MNILFTLLVLLVHHVREEPRKESEYNNNIHNTYNIYIYIYTYNFTNHKKSITYIRQQSVSKFITSAKSHARSTIL